MSEHIGAASDTLTIEGLSGGYDRFDVIHDIAFRVGAGEAVALLGPNGAGKTTVLRAIMGLLPRRRGRIEIEGSDIAGLPTRRIARGLVGLVPEGRRLFTGQSVEDNLRLGGMHVRRDTARTQELLQSVFDLFPVVERYRAREATALSGGEQQMVAIGRMMMSDPALMLLDEPSLGLAPLAIQDLTKALQRLRGQNRSILLVEQRVDMALEVCDRVYVLSEGRIVDEGRAADIGAEGRALIDAYLG
ncbi:ABC transporter ATP-binding protein [Microbacterium sp. RD1]|uniref:ABC transporter ATP-binding protein n=1 Tax=Microbacterium sp. RD1 TaxID=3457313 RepID=UPI003FA582DF